MENINIVVLNSSTFLGLDKIIKEIIGYDNLSVCISDIDSFSISITALTKMSGKITPGVTEKPFQQWIFSTPTPMTIK